MIDINKKYRTKDGKEVRIYAVDGGGSYPVHGAIWEDDRWRMMAWTVKGTGGDSELDLVEVQEIDLYLYLFEGQEKPWIYFEKVDLGSKLYGKPIIASEKVTVTFQEGVFNA